MMTLGELMNIDSGRQSKAAGCTVELMKIYYELKTENIPEAIKSSFGGKNTLNFYYIIFKFLVTSDTGKKHTVLIKTNPSNNWENNTAQVYCDCEDFKYRSAYTLENFNALFQNDKVKISLGPALSTPPKRTTSLLCKHAYAAVKWLVLNYYNIIKTI